MTDRDLLIRMCLKSAEKLYPFQIELYVSIPNCDDAVLRVVTIDYYAAKSQLSPSELDKAANETSSDEEFGKLVRERVTRSTELREFLNNLLVLQIMKKLAATA